ncbi:hypothetical protein ACROYT_G033292 [Oculina patagonica]
MATTARRIGLSTRYGRKTSREEDGATSRSRKISSGRKISREENMTTSLTRKLSRGVQESEMFSSVDTICETSRNNEKASKISDLHCSFNAKGTSDKPRRKISVYARPESLERKVNPQGSQTSWEKFLMRYEPIILSTLVLLIVSVSIYIVFVERQSLFSK